MHFIKIVVITLYDFSGFHTIFVLHRWTNAHKNFQIILLEKCPFYMFKN